MVTDVVIAGAGIGGLTLALALRRRGVSVRCLERAVDLKGGGAGLSLAPNAMRGLRQVGLEGAALEAGEVILRAAILDEAGRSLTGEMDIAKLNREAGAATLALHRARLHGLLLDAVGRDVVHRGVSVRGYEQSGDRVIVHCGHGDEHIETDLLIGADGLRSVVRAQMIGDGEPRYSGYTSWRGVTPAYAVPLVTRMSESWGRGERFGIVAIGFGEIYWFACADAPPGGRDGDARAELLARFGGWHAPVEAIIRVTPAEQILRTDISDRRPVRCWHAGRVVLLGDAAHPMTPNLGQGAGQAIEDALVLDRCLAEAASVEWALRAYERKRMARANAIVRASRRVGEIAHWRNAFAVRLRNAAMRVVPATVRDAHARRIFRESAF
jgi:2-polyprenyl-6-methoxyphenol hydroxylase-like FAD-dependent oxidoreductase